MLIEIYFGKMFNRILDQLEWSFI